jgi:uncharacterized protein (DUF2141 family)
MKVITAVLAFVVVLQTSINTTKKANTEKRNITVTVVNVSSNKGKVSYALYDKDSFMKKPIQTQSGSPKGNKSTVTFTNVAPGNYSVLCFHDANSNDQMDFQSNGMPIEDYGASNNSMSFGPPNFEDSNFEVSDKDVTLEIRF